MSTKIIVSYDGTANEDDAIALGRVFARAGAEVSLAYVRHTRSPTTAARRSPRTRPRQLLERGAELLGNPDAATHVVTDRSTPEGLRRWPRPRAPTRSCSARTPTPPRATSRRQLRRAPARGRHAPRSRSRPPVSPRRAQRPAAADRRGRRRQRRRPGDRRGPRRGARSDRRAGRQRGRRPARDRLAPRGRAGPGLDQLLRIAPDRDRHLLGAGRAARRDAVLRQATAGAVA